MPDYRVTSFQTNRCIIMACNQRARRNLLKNAESGAEWFGGGLIVPTLRIRQDVNLLIQEGWTVKG